ncbi:hypothetical protein SprV_0200953900 [Sparganum proliferum]
MAADEVACGRCNKSSDYAHTTPCGHKPPLNPCLTRANSKQSPFNYTETHVIGLQPGTPETASRPEPSPVCLEFNASCQAPAVCDHRSEVTMKPVKSSKGGLANRFQNVFKDVDWRRCYRRLVLVVVSLAIFLDNILLTSIVPIVPNILMTFKAKNVLTSVLEHSEHNCTSYASLVSTLTDAITHLTSSTSYAQAAHGTLSEIDFLDPSVASEQDRRQVTRLLQNLQTLADNCNINTTAMAKEVRELRTDREDFAVGMLFASKSIVQLIVSPMVGPLTNIVASEQDRRQVTRLLQNLQTLADNCNINTTAMAKEVRELRTDREDFAVGMLFASKSIVQLIVSPMVGPLTNMIGYSIPMLTGLIMMFASTITFAFGGSYVFLLLARAVQGAGSAFATVSGLGTLATYYTDPEGRSQAFGCALTSLALGLLVGPTYGGVLYQFIGRRAPFLILSALMGLCGILQIIVFKPAFQREEEKGTPLCRLLMDPYILVAAGALMFGTFGMAVLEPTMPMWMKKSMKSESWEQGIIFLVSSIAYLLTANILAQFVHKVGHWLSALLGMIISGVPLICVPFARTVALLCIPIFVLGVGAGMLESSLMPLMGTLVDLRHVSVYGSVYAIADAALCLSFAIGPMISGILVQAVGFGWTVRSMAIVSVSYAPLLLLLRNPQRRAENRKAEPAEDDSALKPVVAANDSKVHYSED